METTIKQAEEERTRALQESKRLLKEYQPVKEQINKIREVLQLEKVGENDDDETALFTMQWVFQSMESKKESNAFVFFFSSKDC